MTAEIVNLRAPSVVIHPQRGPMLHLQGGWHVHPFTMTAAEVRGDDIVRGLSNICRFGGHTSSHYSVAQHSFLVASLVPREYEADALLHDAAEAYIGDIVRPLKQWLEPLVGIAAFEERILRCIYEKAGRDWANYEASKSLVKSADNLACATEARDLLGEDFRPFGFPEPLVGRQWSYTNSYYAEALQRTLPGLFA